MMTPKQIEEIEFKYLNKFYHFMKYLEDEMMFGFQTKEKIKEDWFGKYSTNISDFSVGAERIVYALFNGKGIGQPNSSPVGSDIFFEVEDAFIHIDLKTVQTKNNIGDFTNKIFVGTNQNSYKSNMEVRRKGKSPIIRTYTPSLPTFYNASKKTAKVCLSYFLTILYDPIDLDILNINLISMPNGELERHYGSRVLSPGKNEDKARFNFTEVSRFELLEDSPRRIKVVYFDENMKSETKQRLHFLHSIYLEQTE